MSFRDNQNIRPSLPTGGGSSTRLRRFSPLRSRIENRWHNGERGAALVEAAIVFLPLCVILFGIIEYGFIFKDSLTISSATRSGARTASAEAKSTSFYEDTLAAVQQSATGLTLKGDEVLTIYRANTDGLPVGGVIEGCTQDCQVYQYSMATKAFVKISGTGSDWTKEEQKACLGDAQSVGVHLKIKHDALSGFFHDMTLQEKTVMRLEPLGTNCGTT